MVGFDPTPGGLAVSDGEMEGSGSLHRLLGIRMRFN